MEGKNESKHIEFLREYAKCGIYHNYTEPEAKLKVMNEAVAYCSALQAEVDRLTKENHDYSVAQTGNLAKLDELNKWIASDSVYTLLRYGTKSPSHSGVDDCEDDYYSDLYNLSIELRTRIK